MSDIVQRLRDKELLSIEEDGYTHFLPKNPDGDDGADEITRLRAENEKLREALGKQAEKYIRLIELMQEKETLHDPYEDGINAGLRLAVNIIKESVESGE